MMHIGDVKRLVDSTKDAAFGVDRDGLVVAWNAPCEALFGLSAAQTLARACYELLHGKDECGPVCAKDCNILRAVAEARPIGNFDMQVQTQTGRIWCNFSIMRTGGKDSWSIHIIRPIDVRKRLEVLVRDFVLTTTDIPEASISQLLGSTRSPRQVSLTPQELTVLRLLAKGTSTADIATTLFISRATVNNHVQNVMQKFDAHTRLEAIRRAEFAGLL